MLVLIMTVALTIGISVVQRSLSDVSTSTKIEQSSRAFSAAEAGIERALKDDYRAVNFPENNSSATVSTNSLIPAIPSGFNRQDPFECPPGESKLAKEDMAQIWLADPNSSSSPPAEYYKPPSHRLDVYWGDHDLSQKGDKAALELSLIYYAGGYKVQKWYLDQEVRTPDNGFEYPTKAGSTVICSGNNEMIYADGSKSGIYQCKKTLESLPPGLMLIRARLVYNNADQPFAVQAAGTCGRDCSIPPQAKVLVSTGLSGQAERKIQLCQTQKVVPSYLDYAIFASGEINK